MKSKKYILIFVSVIILIFIICIVIKSLPVKNNLNSIPEFGNISNISYKIIQNYSGYVQDRTKRGYYIDTLNKPNAPWFYIITMGTQSSGGYSMEIVDLKIDENRNVKVTVKENKPASGQAVTMSLTYPTICLELSQYAETIEIKNTNGQVFEKLN